MFALKECMLSVLATIASRSGGAAAGGNEVVADAMLSPVGLLSIRSVQGQEEGYGA